MDVQVEFYKPSAEVETPASPVTITDVAAERINKLLEDNDSAALRIYVEGGGCSGFQYGFALDQETKPGDTVIEHNGAQIFIDMISFQYLAGSTIDFKTELLGSRFVITNPNASSMCGCGESVGF